MSPIDSLTFENGISANDFLRDASIKYDGSSAGSNNIEDYDQVPEYLLRGYTGK
jgi:hypothetical protein